MPGSLMLFRAFSMVASRKATKQSGFTCYAHPMRPESKGHIHITSSDPHRPPAINFNFLSAPPDAELTVRAVRIARAIMTAPAMAPFQVTEVAPGADRNAPAAGSGNLLEGLAHLHKGLLDDCIPGGLGGDVQAFENGDTA